MTIFGTIEEKNENPSRGQPVEEVAQEFLRGLVDPVNVLQDEKKGSALALAQEEVPEGFEGPLLFLAGFQLKIGLVLHFQGEQVLEAREAAWISFTERENFLGELFSSERLWISLLNLKIGSQDIQEGQIDHGAA